MNRIYKILVLGLVLLATIHIASASDYECIDKIDTKSPPPVPSFVKVNEDIKNTPLCSDGKVPKAITNSKDNDIVTEILLNDSEIQETCGSGGKCYEFVTNRQFVDNKGAFAYLTQHNPQIDQYSGMSSGAGINVGYSNNGNWLQNWISLGWGKNKGDVTRLYTDYRVDGVTHSYYDGWVQTSNYYYPGMTIGSTDYGIAYEIRNYDGNWWIIWNGEWLGYYPGYLWNGEFDQGDLVTYQGFVVTTTAVTATDMGNGLWASNSNAAKIYSEEYVDAYSDNWYTAYTEKYATNPSLYSLYVTGSNSMRYGGPGSTSTGSCSITVNSPNSGEIWPRGTTKAIKWSHSGSDANVKIELWKGGSYYKTIASTTPNDNYYSWNVPWIKIGSDYKIKITNTANSGCTDTSNNNFKIAGINVNSPNGGNSWARGSIHAITWSSVGSPGANVKIELLKGGSYYRTITSSTGNDGYYSWKIPYVTTASDYKIKITSTSNSVYMDKSDNNFRIY